MSSHRPSFDHGGGTIVYDGSAHVTEGSLLGCRGRLPAEEIMRDSSDYRTKAPRAAFAAYLPLIHPLT